MANVQNLEFWQASANNLVAEGRAFINGQYVDAVDGGTFACVSPIDQRILCQVASCTEADADLAAGSQDNKSTFTQDIETAENKIFDSQGKIDEYIVEKQPLEKKMLTLEAEIGPSRTPPRERREPYRVSFSDSLLSRRFCKCAKTHRSYCIFNYKRPNGRECFVNLDIVI